MSVRTLSLTVLALALLAPALALTQNAEPRSPRGGRGGGPGQLRERMLDTVKAQLGASDEQWKTLAPKVEKVMTLQREARGGLMLGRGGDAPSGDAAGGDENKASDAHRKLRETLDKKDAPEAEITKALAAYREARDKARDELKAAQKDLKQGATAREEAVFVSIGLID